MKLSDAELYTWNFLEDHRPKVQVSSITEIAELAHVSTATIVRALKKQGFDGFSDYKNSLKHEERGSLSLKGFSNEAENFIFKNMDEVTRTINLLDVDVLEAVSRLISKSKVIITVARGLYEGVSDDLTHRLQTVGKNAISRYYDNMGMYAERLTSEDLLLIISSTGEEPLIIDAVKKAKKQEAKVVALTYNYQSELVKLADYTILAYKSHLEREELGGDAESTIPMELVSRVLVDIYLIFEEKGSIRS